MLGIGCGTGLNFLLLLAPVARSGQVVGVDRNREMLGAARRRTIHAPPGDVALAGDVRSDWSGQQELAVTPITLMSRRAATTRHDP